MKKRFLNLFLALAMCLSLLPVTALAAETKSLLLSETRYSGDGQLSRVDLYTYDDFGNLLVHAHPFGHSEYTYDTAGNLLKVTSYDNDGASYVTEEYTYDAAGRLQNETHFSVDGSVRKRHTYDNAGNELSFFEYNSDGSIVIHREYTYDADGRTLSETDYESDGSLYYIAEYIYDAAGNLLRKDYVRRADGSVIASREYTYDASGNMLSDIYVSGTFNFNGHHYEYTYDAAGNRLSTISRDRDASILYRIVNTYDPAGNLVRAITYDGDGSVSSSSAYTYDAYGNMLNRTNYESDGSIEYRTDYEYAVFMLPDESGSLPNTGGNDDAYMPGEIIETVGGIEITLSGLCFQETLVVNFAGSGTEPRPTEMLVLHLTEDAVITIRNDSDADGVYGISEDGWMIHDGVIDMGAGGADEYTLALGETEIIELPVFDPEAPWLGSFYLSSSPETYWFDGTENEYQIYYVKDNGDFSFEPYLANADKAPASGTAYTRTQPVSIDGVAVELEAYALKDPATGYETNYVKLRDVAYALNGTAAQFNVGWDGSVNIITDTAYVANGTEMSTPFAGDRAYTVPTAGTNINGVAADLAAIVLTDDSGGGYTYYKLRDLGKALGFNVGWSAERGIFIETDKPYAE